MAEYDTVAIVGVGLIGGSIGLALREHELAREVVGIGRRESSLEAAREVGAFDRGTTDLADGVDGAEIVVVCTPVDLIADVVAQVAAACPPQAVITDAGSTKAMVVAAADEAVAGRAKGPRFVGSHPLAGDDRSGPQFARANLFVGRTVVITPTDATHADAIAKIGNFWQSLGAKVVPMTPAAHDAALAATSHLPHLVAAVLAAATPEDLLPLAASGWRDTTRVAGGDPELWRPIFAENRAQVCHALDHFGATLEAARDALQRGDDDRLLEILQQAKSRKAMRDALGD
jgi:prephenate dehydrogenase